MSPTRKHGSQYRLGLPQFRNGADEGRNATDAGKSQGSRPRLAARAPRLQESRRRVGLGLAMIAVLAVVSLAACGGGGEPAPEPVSLEPARVRVAAVVVKPRAAVEEVAGTVESKSRATIEAKISGRIVELPVVAGQTVRRGQMLARLDVREIQARLEQARARLEQAQRDRARFAKLLERQAVTQRQYDEVQAQYRVAQAAVTEAETMFGYATITAPFDGVVVRKIADVGDLASPGKPLLVLEDPSALQVQAHVSEALIARVRLGDRLSINAGSLDHPVEAVVSEIAPAADPASRTFLVKLDLADPAGLRSGQFVRVGVPVGTVTAPHVPLAAVVRRGQLEMAFVADGGHAHMRLVKTGKITGDQVEILAGLEGDERVVVDGADTLVDNQPIVLE